MLPLNFKYKDKIIKDHAIRVKKKFNQISIPFDMTI